MQEAHRTSVLFMQSQEFFGADSQIHASIMRHLDPARFVVHCAYPRARRSGVSPSAQKILAMSGVLGRATEFGPSTDGLSRREFIVQALKRGLSALVSIVGLVVYARRHRIAIVHCTEKPRDVLVGYVVARLGGAKFVVHVHVKAETWIRPSVRSRMARADALIGVSEFVSGSIRTLGYDPSKVHTVLNGLELDEWLEASVPREQVRAEFGVADSAPVLISAARLYRYKGQHELIEALPAVKTRFPNVHVLIVGKDDSRSFSEEESYAETLRRMSDELGVQDCVTFTGWRSDVRELMAASDLYVMPSFEEPFGMVFIEAMHLGKPVVASNNGGTVEVVPHGECGLLSEPGDIAAVAANIIRLLEDDDLYRGMAARGRERVRSYLNAERMTRDLEHVYERVTGS